MKEALIVSAVRTAVGKAPKGTLRDTRADEMGAAVIKEAMVRVPGLEAAEIEDVIMGCAMPEAEQGMNVARIASLRAGLPVEVSALTINRFCSSGLQSIAMAAETMANELRTAIDEANAKLIAQALEAYYVAEELARDPAHADLIPHVEAMRAVADAAVAVCAEEGFLTEAALVAIATAKAQAGASAEVVARLAHQVHGAIGTTQEHSLHRVTLRLWSWRDEFGSERYWQEQLGRLALAGDPWEEVTR